ncbi:hypothetical protein LJE71_05330 [Xanthobacter autotrophicus]|uniref:hypothetical protein n=1 Tax=Xanthobacter autotrophicus TaxID=280 RepID=UPI001E574527|nr:hypothetical protein [Xanthobacter autotrophicus]UDQ90429.1 hypothetical protein LJE71_05330 [Xanthobacter autotrophicus]
MAPARRLLMLVISAIVCAAVASAPVVATAETAGEDCGKAAWPLASARTRLASPLRTVEPGGRLSLPLEGAVTLALSDRASAALPFQPTRRGRESQAGFARITVPPPGGDYQITVSDGAWLDVFADGKPLAPLAFTGVHTCPGVRKSLRFRLPAGEAVLVVTDAAGAGLAMVIDPVWP